MTRLPPAHAERDVAVAATKALARPLFGTWNAGAAAALDRLLAPDYVLHPGDRPDVRGLDAYRAFTAAYRAALPGLHWTVGDDVGSDGRQKQGGSMTVQGLCWLGVRTPHFAETVAFYRDVLGLEQLKDELDAAAFRLGDGTEVHVYGPNDADHDFFGVGPVVGLLVDDFAATRARMVAAGIEFIGAVQQDGTATWNHFRGPDGNVYEIMERTEG